MAALGQAVVAREGGALQIRIANPIKEALEGASFVLNRIRVAGIEYRAMDERISVTSRYPGQETTGPAGVAMALRTVPVSQTVRGLVLAVKAYEKTVLNPAMTGSPQKARAAMLVYPAIGHWEAAGELVHRFHRTKRNRTGGSTREACLKQVSILLVAALIAGAQSNSSAGQTQEKLAKAASLARLHRFAEAERTIEGIKAPQDAKQAIAFHRLRASIDAGLHKPEECSVEMHTALRLSPNDPGLLKATALADLVWLEVQLQAGSHAGVPAALDNLRGLNLPDAERAELRHRVGEQLSSAHEFREAVVDLSESVRLDPSNAEWWAQLADAQLKAGNAKAALESAQEAKALHENADIEALLGDIHEAAGDSVSAARSFEEAVRLSPGEERFRLALAVELLQHQTFQPALKVLERSAIDFPQSSRIATALGLTLYLAGKEKAGIFKLLQAASLDPTFVPAIHYLGEISLIQSGLPEPKVVASECKYAAAHSSDDQSNTVCGALQARVASADPGIADWAPILHRLSLVVARSPNLSLARCEYGKALDQARDSGARMQLEACVRLDPNSIEAHYRLARMYDKIGWKDAARKELALRAAAEQRITALNSVREESVKRFLYSMVDDVSGRSK